MQDVRQQPSERAMKTPVVTVMLLLTILLFGRSADAADQPGIFPFGNDEAPAQFLKQVQAAVSSDDKERVADFVKFPVLVRLRGRSVQIARRTFLARYNEIFTTDVKSALLSAKFESRSRYDRVWWNWQGMMVGDGEVWFAGYGDGSIKIKTINN